MKTFSEKEEKLNFALDKLKKLKFTNPKLKEHTENLFNQKNQLEIEKREIWFQQNRHKNFYSR